MGKTPPASATRKTTRKIRQTMDKVTPKVPLTPQKRVSTRAMREAIGEHANAVASLVEKLLPALDDAYGEYDESNVLADEVAQFIVDPKSEKSISTFFGNTPEDRGAFDKAVEQADAAIQETRSLMNDESTLKKLCNRLGGRLSKKRFLAIAEDLEDCIEVDDSESWCVGHAANLLPLYVMQHVAWRLWRMACE